MRYLLFSLFLFSICVSCTNSAVNTDDGDFLNCSSTAFSVTQEDNIVVNNANNPVAWKGNYNNSTVKIDYTLNVGDDGETEQFIFVFKKANTCLKIDYAYKFYDGKQVDISAITTIPINETHITKWEVDKVLAGVIVFTDPHSKKTFTRKFWVNFSESDFFKEPTDFNFFVDCLGGKIPLDIDVNKDEIIDFKIIYEKQEDIGNTPKFDTYTVKLISTDPSNNKILSPIKSEPPYFIVYEPPFSSENTRQYFNGVKNELDVFYEFEAPFQSYNFFLNNLLTYKGKLGNDFDDYFVISMILNNETYYGWIKFSFKVLDCEIEILDTFLNSTANEHVFVN